MTFTFRPAVRENVSLLIGLAGGTGSGKTKSAMILADGMTPPGKRFAVIDTEAGRAKHYADEHQFDHGDLTPPFTPERYLQAIAAADKAGYPVIVVDSASHEHAGDGGLLDMHEAELYRMAKDDWQKREACKIAAWVKPKGEHKAFVNKLLQVRAHLILCFRAEEKIEIKQVDGKWKAVPKQSRTGKDGWIPVCEKNLPFELTCSFLLLADKPGVPNAIKCEGKHRPFFPSDRPITADAGAALAAWAAGGKPISGRESRTSDHGQKGAAGDGAPFSAADDEERARKRIEALKTAAEVAAKGGAREWATFWNGLPRNDRELLLPDRERLKQIAADSDAAVMS